MESVPFFDDVIELVDRPVVFQALRSIPLIPAQGLGEFLEKGLVLSKLLQDRLMREVVDVLDVVERSRFRVSMVRLLSGWWFSGNDACVEFCQCGGLKG